MQVERQIQKSLVSDFDLEQKMFSLKASSDSEIIYTIDCNIKLQGIVNGENKIIDFNLPSDNYSIHRFINPYLNAENDTFKINYSDKSVGYIIPSSSIQDNGENDEDFDVYKQAYKFYCAKLIIESYDFNLSEQEERNINFSDIIDENSIYFIIYNPLIKEDNFNLENCLPSLAIKGYYLFLENTIPNIQTIAVGHSSNEDLNTLLELHFLSYRLDESIHIQKSLVEIEKTLLLKLLYKKLLIENRNALYRFLVIYQVIEFFVENNVRKSIDQIFEEKDRLNNYDFFEKVHQANNTRSIINKLFDKINFELKADITNSLSQFIQLNIPAYSKTSTGDCLYDIRNLLFHDFKKVMESQDEASIIGLVIQCEILIHNLINSLEV